MSSIYCVYLYFCLYNFSYSSVERKMSFFKVISSVSCTLFSLRWRNLYQHLPWKLCYSSLLYPSLRSHLCSVLCHSLLLTIWYVSVINHSKCLYWEMRDCQNIYLISKTNLWISRRFSRSCFLLLNHLLVVFIFWMHLFISIAVLIKKFLREHLSDSPDCSSEVFLKLRKQ